jgi:hypothetical protein
LYQKVFRSVNSDVSKISNIDNIFGIKPSCKVKKNNSKESNNSEVNNSEINNSDVDMHSISLNDIIEKVKKEQNLLADEFPIEFIRLLCKKQGKLTTTPTKDTILKLHAYYNHKNFNSIFLYLQNEENIILKSLDDYKYNIIKINNKKSTLINKFNNKIRKLLKLDDIVLCEGDTIQDYDDIVKNYKEEYDKLIYEMQEESENLLTEDDLILLNEFNDKLNEFKSVIYTKLKYNKIKTYLSNNINKTNTSIISLRNTTNIDEVANEICNGLKF